MGNVLKCSRPFLQASHLDFAGWLYVGPAPRRFFLPSSFFLSLRLRNHRCILAFLLLSIISSLFKVSSLFAISSLPHILIAVSHYRRRLAFSSLPCVFIAGHFPIVMSDYEYYCARDELVLALRKANEEIMIEDSKVNANKKRMTSRKVLTTKSI